jgi:hypothetical protein
MKPFLVAIFLSGLSTGASAANRYEAVPMRTTATGGNQYQYDALVTDEVATGGRYCRALENSNFTVQTVSCWKATVSGGAMPAGHAVLSTAPLISGTIDKLGLWKVDQTDGAVTFCAANYNGTSWDCKIAVQQFGEAPPVP